MKLDCDLKIKNNLFKEPINKLKPRNIGFIEINNIEYVLKIENINNLKNMNEYQFYIKNINKIKLYNFNEIIQIPIEYKVCKKENQIKYIFHKLDNDIDTAFLNKISKKDRINIFEQLLLSLYFINHKLHYFHNDLYTSRKFFKLNNCMYIKNNSIKTIKIDNFSLQIGKYKTLIIDFGLSTKTSGYKLNIFYKGISALFLYDFKYKSELFILFIIIYHTHHNNFNISLIKKFYVYFEKNMKKLDLLEFDKSIYNNFKYFC